MVFTWDEYLDLAKFLSQILPNPPFDYTREAAIRSSISRAYYAAFCHARNYAIDKDQFQPTGKVDDHFFVKEHYKNKKQTDISSRLDRLRNYRNDCDYNNVVYNLDNICITALQQSEYIINKL